MIPSYMVIHKIFPCVLLTYLSDKSDIAHAGGGIILFRALAL